MGYREDDMEKDHGEAQRRGVGERGRVAIGDGVEMVAKRKGSEKQTKSRVEKRAWERWQRQWKKRVGRVAQHTAKRKE
jgi:hypothetical protein